MKKIFCLTFVVLIILASSAFSQQAEITVECVQGLKIGTIDTLKAGSQVVFGMTYTNGYDARQLATNAYKLSSPDGATWSYIDFYLVSPPPPCFQDLSYPFYPESDPWDGISPDYITVGPSPWGKSWETGPTYDYTGPIPWSYECFQLTFYLDDEQIGKHIVLDKTTLTGFTWVWSQLEANPGPAVNLSPAWGGPYEYYIAESCCNGMVGNADCSELEEPDISDMVRVIDYLYISHDPLCCPEEADFDGNGDPEPDVSDLTFLMRHLYLDHPPLPECP